IAEQFSGGGETYAAQGKEVIASIRSEREDVTKKRFTVAESPQSQNGRCGQQQVNVDINEVPFDGVDLIKTGDDHVEEIDRRNDHEVCQCARLSLPGDVYKGSDDLVADD